MATTEEQLRRVRNLIRLSVDPATSEEEARTAAHAAIQMIHRYSIALGGGSPAAPPAELKDAYDEGYREGFEEGRDEGFAKGRDEGHREGLEQGLERGRMAGAAQVRTAAAAAPSSSREPRERWLITAKFAKHCRYCGVRWEEGDQIAWAPGLGATCVDCRSTGID